MSERRLVLALPPGPAPRLWTRRPARGPGVPAAPPARRRVWAVAALALLLDVAVCVPFLFDPWGWREPTLPAPGAPERTEYLLFLAGPPQSAARAAFFAGHPLLRVEHEGGWGSTLAVSLPAAASALAGELRRQPFVRLLTRGGLAFCRAS